MHTIMTGLWTLAMALQDPAGPAHGWEKDEFQFRFSFKQGGTAAYVYIPADARKIRALLLLQQHVSEQMFSVHPAVRRACDANAVAIAWCRPGFDATFEQDPGSVHDLLQEEFGRFGREIGYPELGEVPLITYGHSTTCAYAQNAAESRPDRVLAVLSTHGGSRVEAFVRYRGPILIFTGHYWEQRQQTRNVSMNRNMLSLSKIQKKLKAGWMPISVVEEYGSGHFDYSDEVVSVFAMFIDKAVKARLDSDGRLRDVDPASGTVALIPSSPDGPILVQPWSEDSARGGVPAWYFDRELAEAAARVIGGNGPWQRACQLIGFNRMDGTPAPFGKSGLVNPVPYEIVPGTNEIRLRPFLHRVFPEGFAEAGQPLGVCSDPKIHLEYVCGPYLTADAQGKIRVRLNRGSPSGYVVARNGGDKDLRPTVQPTKLTIDGAGAGFPSPVDPGPQKCGSRISLKEASTSTDFVGYYVDHGPARVVGNTLEILSLPANTKGPVEVELVAYKLRQVVSGSSSVKFTVGR